MIGGVMPLCRALASCLPRRHQTIGMKPLSYKQRLGSWTRETGIEGRPHMAEAVNIMLGGTSIVSSTVLQADACYKTCSPGSCLPHEFSHLLVLLYFLNPRTSTLEDLL